MTGAVCFLLKSILVIIHTFSADFSNQRGSKIQVDLNRWTIPWNEIKGRKRLRKGVAMKLSGEELTKQSSRGNAFSFGESKINDPGLASVLGGVEKRPLRPGRGFHGGESSAYPGSRFFVATSKKRIQLLGRIGCS